jgi:hypothetical protein
MTNICIIKVFVQKKLGQSFLMKIYLKKTLLKFDQSVSPKLPFGGEFKDKQSG